MRELRVMQARRKRLVLDKDELQDPIAGSPADEERGEPDQAASSSAKRRRTPKPSTKSRDPTPDRSRSSDSPAELLSGTTEQMAVRLDDEVWTMVVELAGGVKARGGYRVSTTTVVATTLAFACPAGDAEALDLVARHELELTQGPGGRERSEHNVRLPRRLRRRLDELAKSVRAAGFAGGRSALVNAVLARRAPVDAQAAAEQLDQLRRARAAAFVQPADSGPL